MKSSISGFFIYSVALAKDFQVPRWAPQSSQLWRDCAMNRDCVKIYGACGEFVSVNKKYAKDATKYYKKIRPMVECDHVEGESKGEYLFIPECKMNLCVHRKAKKGLGGKSN